MMFTGDRELIVGRGSFMKRGLSALQIAAVYIGTIIGAGFATGKEIVEFFYSLWVLWFSFYLYFRCAFYYSRNEDDGEGD